MKITTKRATTGQISLSSVKSDIEKYNKQRHRLRNDTSNYVGTDITVTQLHVTVEMGHHNQKQSMIEKSKFRITRNPLWKNTKYDVNVA